MSATKLYGLVLAGGKSTRMGKDKGEIIYHDQPQRLYAYNLLKELCDNVFLSIRPDQLEDFRANYNVVVDENVYRGPFNGIMSSHNQYPEVAWLVLATDLPLLQKQDLKELIDKRNPNKLATAYATKESNLPEPLIAIWEPTALKKSKGFLDSAVGTCPRKFLINNNIQLVYPSNDQVLMNANTVSDFNSAKEKITSS
ncbi:molybdenum cofactor guanylyltransferase [Flavobacteriaceae bacterium MAR_2010_188]|nr:molybdenum cofactor guanylyltransferase [Flavobacteriaceae bacterium MAR_2010_188]